MGGRVRRRAETKEETRRALVAAALAEIAEHGLDAPSLDAICARAGYTRGAFYVHFRDRGDLLVAVVEHAMGMFLDAVIARGDEAHDLEHTIVRFADALAATLAPTGGAGAVARGQDRPQPAAALPLPASVPFARIVDAVTRTPRLAERFGSLLAGAVARVHEATARAQEARTVRADVDAAQAAPLLAIIALGTLVALDVGMPLDPVALRDTVLRLLVPAPSPRRRAGATAGGIRSRRRC